MNSQPDRSGFIAADTSIKKHGVDMNTSLLTPDGFPRADIDVAQSKDERDLSASGSGTRLLSGRASTNDKSEDNSPAE